MKIELYENLYIRKATKKEYKYFYNYFGKSFSGYVACNNGNTTVILNSRMKYTPYMCYRMNSARNILICACYSRYDTIKLNKNGEAINELHYTKDNFKCEKE